MILKVIHVSSLGICKLPECDHRNKALDDAMLLVNYGFLGIALLPNGLQEVPLLKHEGVPLPGRVLLSLFFLHDLVQTLGKVE